MPNHGSAPQGDNSGTTGPDEPGEMKGVAELELELDVGLPSEGRGPVPTVPLPRPVQNTKSEKPRNAALVHYEPEGRAAIIDIDEWRATKREHGRWGHASLAYGAAIVRQNRL